MRAPHMPGLDNECLSRFETAQQGRRVSRLRILQLVIATAVVAFLIVTAKPAEIWVTLKEVDLAKACAALLMNVPVILLASWRSALILRRMGHKVPLRVLVPTTLVGYVAGAVTPVASGELLR